MKTSPGEKGNKRQLAGAMSKRQEAGGRIQGTSSKEKGERGSSQHKQEYDNCAFFSWLFGGVSSRTENYLFIDYLVILLTLVII